MRNRHKWAWRGVVVWAAALLCFELVALSVSSEELVPRAAEGNLHISAPRLHFLAGRSLQRLRDGIAVPFDFQLSVASGAKTNITERAVERFVVSYDLWEEKFSVVRSGTGQRAGQSLSSQAAESWCTNQISIPLAKIPAEHLLWARLEIRSADARLESTTSEHGISITGLIDIFSRPVRPQQDRWSVDYGPFRKAELLNPKR